jgi:hypothetical protein
MGCELLQSLRPVEQFAFGLKFRQADARSVWSDESKAVTLRHIIHECPLNPRTRPAVIIKHHGPLRIAILSVSKGESVSKLKRVIRHERRGD